MSVEFISGKPGDGKSLRAMMIIEEELRLTKRHILTNLAIRIGDLAEQLNERYGESFDINTRLRILTVEETLCFWLYPAPSVDLDPKQRVEWKAADGRKLVVPDLSGWHTYAPSGALIVVDEAHIPFGARTWQANGTDGFYYLSQHEKLKCDVLLVTQHVENVDKQFRSVAAGFVYMKNRSKRNLPVFGGLIRQATGFTQTKFSEPYRMGLHSEETRYFRGAEKLWLANCYDTTAGVGITSRDGQRAKQKKRGFPLWTAAIPITVLLAVLSYVPDMLKAAATSGVSKAQAAVTGVVLPAPVAKSQVASSPAAAPGQRFEQAGIENRKSAKTQDTETNYLTGIFYKPAGFVFVEAGGRERSSKDPDFLTTLRDHSGRVNGVMLRDGRKLSLKY